MDTTKIRKAYPNPRVILTPQDVRADGYTVGGALCRWAEKSNQYHNPSGVQVARALITLNPQLPRRIASAAAYAIIEANDRGDFETAWGLATQAIDFVRRKQ